MTLHNIRNIFVVALAVICTVIAVSLVSSVGNWPLVTTCVVALLMILQMWHPPLRPAFARRAGK